MTKPGLARTAATLAAAAVFATAAGTADAATKTNPGSKAPVACTDHTAQLSLLSFNDFHGRIATASPDTVAFFGTIEKERAAAGEGNSLVLSQGDNIGASLFASAVQDDNPTIDMLNAVDIDSSTIGNHEFDKGFADLTGRVETRSDFGYLSANLYRTGTTDPYFQPYEIFDRSGVKVAVIGAVTGDLKSLVAPDVFNNVDLVDPVEAVNRYAALLSDGNPSNGEADVIIASYHEGAAVSEPKTLADATAYEAFDSIVNETSPEVDAILTAHTHQSYAYTAPVPGTDRTRPVVESGSYAALVGKTVLTIDTTPVTTTSKGKGKDKDKGKSKSEGKGKTMGEGLAGTVCSFTTANLKPVASTQVAGLVAQYPRLAEVQKLNTDAIAQAKTVGERVIASSTAPITRGVNANGTLDNRAVESTASDQVAQMFYDTLSNGDADFIGVQNPGGTRADLPAGDITYAAAAAVLPFANTLMTTQITGAQVKTMLEQQWQTNADGTIPSRAYLQLGLSENVTYTYDETRPIGDRITSISVNGAPIDAAKRYTVGSGNFLITGGDNFRVLAQGQNTRDTGASDLAAWVDWLTAQGTVSPDFARQAVSVQGPTTLTRGTSATYRVGVPAGLQADTLDMKSTGAVANTSLVATIGGVEVGTASVTNGQATITVTVPTTAAAGSATLVLTAQPSGTTVTLPVTIA